MQDGHGANDCRRRLPGYNPAEMASAGCVAIAATTRKFN
jgi:hypothetical protein